jgi:light-regulated signal transduction histidine kinase (bacteriophytochrome)
MLNYQATKQEWETSTKRKSKPLHALQGRPDFSSGTSADLIGTMNEIQSQLIGSTSIEALFGTIVGTVSELTGFDRVMVYRFDECKCGAVVAEYVNPLVSEDLFIGLHFPSSDLPPRTRHLYKADRVQILRHRTSDTASLIYQSPDTVTALDLTGSYLRDVSPDQVKFFSDINVSSAMTISLVVEDDLWGLITCHSYGSTIVEVSPPLREACRNIGQCASSQVERLLFAERLEARILLATGLSRKSPAAFITSSSSSLLQIFAATFGMLVMNDQVRAVGRLESYQEALVLVKYFRTRGVTSVIASQKINADFPDLLYPPGFTLIAGLLVVPLSNSGSDFLVVFRKEQLMEIHWAGNTEERFELIGGGNAEPNASFHRWVEHVTDTSREWTAWQCKSSVIV